jgi:hypothetical protein
MRIIDLEIKLRKATERIRALEEEKPAPTLSVPIVDENGKRVENRNNYFKCVGLTSKEISFKEVCKALQDMCNIEITYQEIKDKSGVVIYEKE